MTDESYLLLQRAAHLLAVKRYREAAELWAQAVAGSPDDPDLLAGWAIALHLAGEGRAALDSAVRAAASGPDNAAAHCVLGLLRSANGQRDAAVAAARDAVRLAPESPDAQAVLCLALLGAGQLGAAAVAQRRLLELAPVRSEVIELAALTWLHAPQRIPAPEVESWLRRALADDPLNADAMTLLAATQLRSTDQVVEAAAMLDGALRLEPDNVPAQRLLSLAVVITALPAFVGGYASYTLLLAPLPYVWHSGHLSWAVRLWMLSALLLVFGVVRGIRSRIRRLPDSARHAFRLHRRGFLVAGALHLVLYGAAVLAVYAAVNLVPGWPAALLGVLAVPVCLALAAVLALPMASLLAALID